MQDQFRSMKSKLAFCIILTFLINCIATAQTPKVTLSGQVKDATSKTALSFVNVTLTTKDSSLIAGTITGDNGRFTLTDIKSGNYILTFTYTGYEAKAKTVTVGQLSNFLELGITELATDAKLLKEVTITGKQEPVAARLDKENV